MNNENTKNIVKSILIIIGIIVIGIIGAAILASQKTSEQKLIGTWKAVSVSEGKAYDRPKYDFVVTFEKSGACSIKDSDPDKEYKEVKDLNDDEYYPYEDTQYTGKDLKKMFPKKNQSGSYNCDITDKSISFSSKSKTYIYSYTIDNDILILTKDSKTIKLARQ